MENVLALGKLIGLLFLFCQLNAAISEIMFIPFIDPLFFRFKIIHFPFQIFTNSVSPPEF